MAADAWVMHDKFKEYMGDATVDLDADSFKMALYLSTSDVATTSLDAYGTPTNEVAQNFGYLTGGKAITTPTWIESSGTVTFKCDNVVWTAAGGSITARFAAIYDDTVAAPVAKPIMCHSLLENPAADVTATDGNTFTVAINASGVFTLANA